MIDKKLINYIALKSKIQNTSLIEKDIILQSLLIDLYRNDYFSKHFAFKGGTCLVKCYFGYYRFSEDLDFTYINQKRFERKSKKQVNIILGNERDNLLSIIQDISRKYNLDFKAEKTDKTYIEYGGSKKFITMKVWYNSAVTGNRQFIKIQVNFIEALKYKTNYKSAKPLMDSIELLEFSFLFPDYKYLQEKPKVQTYDIKEIMLEKIRAILTRRDIKDRDFIDIFLISKKSGKGLEYFKKDAILKIKFMLKYEKYEQNLKDKAKLTEFYTGDQDSYLLLKDLPDGFESFQKKLNEFLKELAVEIIDK